ncbi:putative endonuclease [Marmoricola sp. URHA0025 HA25]
MAWVYLLECSDHSYYVGSTTDLPARLHQHESGLGAAYTARRRPVRLVWALEFESVVDAFAFEKQVQNWSRAKRQALIDGRLGDLPVLARGRTGYLSRRTPEAPNDDEPV